MCATTFLFYDGIMEHEIASEMLRVAVRPSEKRDVEQRAAEAKLTLSAYLRTTLGLEVLSRGGAFPGGGRPCKCAERGIECTHKKTA